MKRTLLKQLLNLAVFSRASIKTFADKSYENDCLNDPHYKHNFDPSITCASIRYNERDRQQYCQDVNMRRSCPLSCGLCCDDNPTYVFDTPNHGDVGCAFIAEEKIMQRLWCGQFKNQHFVRDKCSLSCDACEDYVPTVPTAPKVSTVMPSILPSQLNGKPSMSPNNLCVNNNKFRIDGEEKKSCDWARKNERRRAKQCEKEEVHINCPVSCGLCCSDSPSFTFNIKNGQTKNCEWIAQKRNPRAENYCTTEKNGKNVQDVCPSACDVCKKYISLKPSTKSVSPTRSPSLALSSVPSTMPSIVPSQSPSNYPSLVASATPSFAPSDMPSPNPSRSSISPSMTKSPTRVPTKDPTPSPTEHPTVATTVAPSFSSLTQREVLINLYESTNGNGWKRSDNWLSSINECEWYSVICDFDGYVNWLDLSGNDLIGSIPASIGELKNLQYLNLGGNDLTGTIPESIGYLGNLELLLLVGNDLTGTIPTSMGELGNLNYVWFFDNALTGTIPASIGDLGNLEDIHLGSNDLSGTIPASIGYLSKLSRLSLSFNALTGTIPVSMGDLGNLMSLNLSGSHDLTGTIPASIGNLNNLKYLWLFDNALTGTIPVSIGDLSNLKYLNLGNNELMGTVPSAVCNLSLDLFGYSGNNIDGDCT